jgi:hypothetical protein
MKARAPICAAVSNADIIPFWRALAARTPTTQNLSFVAGLVADSAGTKD